HRGQDSALSCYPHETAAIPPHAVGVDWGSPIYCNLRLSVTGSSMAEMSVIWLRVAAALYSLGLLHAILTLVRRREHLFRVALAAFTIGSIFHFVSIVEEGILSNRCPVNNFYEDLSMCAFLV